MRPGRRNGTKNVLGLVMVVGMISAGTFAFTNTNTVDQSFAGQGADAITGFVVSGVTYASSATNPHKMASVTFNLDQSAREVKVSVVDAADTVTGATGQTWYTCTEDTVVANKWSCATGATDLLAPNMSATNELDVVAYQ